MRRCVRQLAVGVGKLLVCGELWFHHNLILFYLEESGFKIISTVSPAQATPDTATELTSARAVAPFQPHNC